MEGQKYVATPARTWSATGVATHHYPTSARVLRQEVFL